MGTMGLRGRAIGTEFFLVLVFKNGCKDPKSESRKRGIIRGERDSPNNQKRESGLGVLKGRLEHVVSTGSQQNLPAGDTQLAERPAHLPTLLQRWRTPR